MSPFILIPCELQTAIQKIPFEIRAILYGIIVAMVVWLYFRPRSIKSPIFQAILTKTKKGRELLYFLCNLLIIEIGAVISLYTLGNMPMTNSTIHWLIIIIWVTVGIAIGMFIILLYEAARFYWKYRVDNKPEIFLAKLHNKQYKELEKKEKRGRNTHKQIRIARKP